MFYYCGCCCILLLLLFILFALRVKYLTTCQRCWSTTDLFPSLLFVSLTQFTWSDSLNIESNLWPFSLSISFRLVAATTSWGSVSVGLAIYSTVRREIAKEIAQIV